MNIITTTTTDKKKIYQMTQGAGIERMQDHNGEEITVENFVLYEDVKNSGEVMEILSIETAGDAIYATNSPTFKQNFLNIADICGGPSAMIGEKIQIRQGTSKAGRKFYTCTWM